MEQQNADFYQDFDLTLEKITILIQDFEDLESAK